jgi:hypothetical protein
MSSIFAPPPAGPWPTDPHVLSAAPLGVRQRVSAWVTVVVLAAPAAPKPRVALLVAKSRSSTDSNAAYTAPRCPFPRPTQPEGRAFGHDRIVAKRNRWLTIVHHSQADSFGRWHRERNGGCGARTDADADRAVTVGRPVAFN